jgi:hypothetical protein
MTTRQAWINNRIIVRWRCMIVAAMLLMLCPAFAAQAGEWKYIVPPRRDPFEHPLLCALALSDSKPADLREKVVYRGARQQYGRLHLGSPASLDVAVVLDLVTATDVDLYVDVDRNRTIEPSERVAGEKGMWRITLDVLVFDGAKSRSLPRALIFRWSGSARTLRFAVCGYVEGKTTVGGRPCVVRRTDGDGNGLFADPQDRLWIDLDGNGRWDGIEEQFLYAPILVLGGRRYAVHADELGDRLSLDLLQGAGSVTLRLASDLAQRTADVTATLVGRDGFVVSLRQSTGSVTVPVGEYRFSNVTIGVNFPAGGAPLNYVFSDSTRQTPVWRRVARDTSLALDPIGALHLESNFNDAKADVRPGGEVSVKPCFQTGDGLEFVKAYRSGSASEEDSRAVRGRVMLTSPAGRVLSSRSIGFS